MRFAHLKPVYKWDSDVKRIENEEKKPSVQKLKDQVWQGIKELFSGQDPGLDAAWGHRARLYYKDTEAAEDTVMPISDDYALMRRLQAVKDILTLSYILPDLKQVLFENEEEFRKHCCFPQHRSMGLSAIFANCALEGVLPNGEDALKTTVTQFLNQATEVALFTVSFLSLASGSILVPLKIKDEILQTSTPKDIAEMLQKIASKAMSAEFKAAFQKCLAPTVIASQPVTFNGFTDLVVTNLGSAEDVSFPFFSPLPV